MIKWGRRAVAVTGFSAGANFNTTSAIVTGVQASLATWHATSYSSEASVITNSFTPSSGINDNAIVCFLYSYVRKTGNGGTIYMRLRDNADGSTVLFSVQTASLANASHTVIGGVTTLLDKSTMTLNVTFEASNGLQYVAAILGIYESATDKVTYAITP